MQTHSTKKDPRAPARRYTWPWYVLWALLLAIVLAALWLSFEIARTKRIRDLNAPSPQLNQSPAPQGAAAVEDSDWTKNMVWIPAGTFGNGALIGICRTIMRMRP